MRLHAALRRLLPGALPAVVLAGAAVYFAINPPRQVPQHAAFRAGKLTIDGPFLLAAAPDADSAAAYMTIKNGGREGDRLVSGTLDIAERVEIQATDVRDGVTEMEPLPNGVEIPAAGAVTLRPGSYRIMLSRLRRQLKEGEHVGGVLTFEKAGPVHVSYEVGSFVAPLGWQPFSLTSEEGVSFGTEELMGEPYAIFFGYTHCPDVCPTMLYEMSEALDTLGGDADKLRVVFVSVDPERDTPDALKNYLTAFDPRIVGLTGTPQSVDAAAKSFHIYYKKVPGEDGDYSVDHATSVILMDAGGHFVGTIGYREDQAQRVAKLKQLAAGAPL